MGLDMYLYAETFVSGYAHNLDERFDKILEAMNLASDDVGNHLMVKINLAYWRKANSIHNWFVSNCAEGKDDCSPARVSREQLEELVQTCESAISAYKSGDKTEAANLLPPANGFFFGSTEINDSYLADLLETVEKIRKILNNSKFQNADFYYQASW